MDVQFWYSPAGHWYLWKGSAGAGCVPRGAFAVRNNRIRAWFPAWSFSVPSRLLVLLRSRLRDEPGQPPPFDSGGPETTIRIPGLLTSLELHDLSEVDDPMAKVSDLLPPEELGPVGSGLVQFDDLAAVEGSASRRIWIVTRQISLDRFMAIYQPLGEFGSLAEARSAAAGAETVYVQQPGSPAGWAREGF